MINNTLCGVSLMGSDVALREKKYLNNPLSYRTLEMFPGNCMRLHWIICVIQRWCVSMFICKWLFIANFFFLYIFSAEDLLCLPLELTEHCIDLCRRCHYAHRKLTIIHFIQPKLIELNACPFYALCAISTRLKTLACIYIKYILKCHRNADYFPLSHNILFKNCLNHFLSTKLFFIESERERECENCWE